MKWDLICKHVSKNIPNFKIEIKEKSSLMRILSYILFFNKRFRTQFITTLYPVVYFPKQILSNPDEVGRVIILSHEYVHLKDKKRLGILFDFATILKESTPMMGTELHGEGVSDLVILLLGVGSAVIDNVPLVAASLGMFSEPLDNELWHFIAYSAGTGGSMLIIGSAAGVVAMGMEKIDFFWYLKKIAWLALIGFLAGAAVFFFTRTLF